MKRKYCPEVGKPQVNEESLPCCEFTKDICIVTTEANPSLGIGIGKTLAFVINKIAKTIKKIKEDAIKINSKLNYKNFEVLLTQTLTNIPVVVTGKNELPLSPSLTYVSQGKYNITLIGAFPATKTFIYLGTFNKAIDQEVKAYRTDDNTITIETFQAGVVSNNVLNNTPLKIKVYYV